MLKYLVQQNNSVEEAEKQINVDVMALEKRGYKVVNAGVFMPQKTRYTFAIWVVMGKGKCNK